MSRLYIFLYFLLSVFQAMAEPVGRNVKILRYGGADGLMDDGVTCGLQDNMGYIWFATHDGLVRYDGHRFKTYKALAGDDNPLFVNRIDYIAETDNNDILCYSNKTYYRFDKATEKFEKVKGHVVDKHANDDVYDNMALKIGKLDEYKGLPIKVRLIDRQGGIWVASDARGLERVVYVKDKIRNRKVGNDKEEIIRGLMYDHAGRMWVSDKNGHVMIYNRGCRTPMYLGRDGRLSSGRVSFGYNVYDMLEDHACRVWLGTKPGGLFLLEPKTNGFSVTGYRHSDEDAYSISNDAIYSIVEDHRHRIWIGTYGGGLNLVMENNDGSLAFANNNNLFGSYPEGALFIHGMDMSKDVLVIGTTKGLYTCDTRVKPYAMKFFENVKRSNDKTSIGANSINDVICDASGGVYIATVGGGICKVLSADLLSNKLKFKTYTSKEGLATDSYMSLVIDRKQHVWGVGKFALTSLDPSDKHDIVNYHKGLFEDDFFFSEVSPLCLPDGNLVFGTTCGFLMFNPDRMAKSSYIPKIAFDNPENIELQPGEKNVKIEFAALDFNRNEDIVYKYLLEGIDNEWHYTKENSIDYTNFPIGTYRLHIVSTNSDGIWVDNERVITITRRAAFNEMWYSWMLYGILLALFVIGVYKTVKYVARLKRNISEHRRETNAKLDYLNKKVEALMSANTEVSPDVDRSDKDDFSFSEKAKNFVLDNISNSELSVNDFAEYMNISSSLLYIRCKKNLGYTPNSYIQNVRIKYAIKLIQNDPKLGISTIAYKCGFSDPKYFSRCFKKITGRNPKDYKLSEVDMEE